MKKGLMIFLVLMTGFVQGCAAKEYNTFEEAVRDAAVLGKGIYIDGIDVSEMDVLDARRIINEAQKSKLESAVLEIKAGGESFAVKSEELGITFNTDEVLKEAASLNTGLFSGHKESNFYTAAQGSRNNIRFAAEQAAAALDRAPENASAEFGDGDERFVYISHRDGIAVDAKKLEEEIGSRISALDWSPINASYTQIKADYTVEAAKADTELVSEFTTYFKGSTLSVENRVFNIEKAASLIHRTTLEPDEEFSMNKALGPRNGERGWRTAAGIKNGAYVQEYGGGVCQVSTTLYNAALMADLEITDRSHHSWPLAYVDIGRDATISTGGPDFCFKNTSGARLFIEANVDKKEKSVTVRIYGRPLEDGISISLRSKKTDTLEAPGTRVEVDETLSAGEEKVVREARTGAVSETYKEYYSAEGEFIKSELVSRDKYRPIEGIIAIGPSNQIQKPEPEKGETAVIGE